MTERARGRRVRIVGLLIAGAWVAFVLATNLEYRWDRTIPGYPLDVIGYERIAEAAPGLPNGKTEAAQHAQRLAPHYAVGLVSDATGLSVRRTYDLAAALVLAAVILVAQRLFTRVGASLSLYAVLIGAVITNLYVFRLVAGAPGMLADAVFVLGVGLMLLGLVERRLVLLSAGMVVCVLGRGDTSVIALLAFGAWLVLDARWWASKHLPSRVVATLGVSAPAGLAWIATNLVARRFSSVNTPGLSDFTILGTLKGLPGTLSDLAGHVLSTGLGIVVPLLLLLLGLGLARRFRVSLVLEPALAGALVLAAGIVVQALTLNPDWLHGSEPRLAALSELAVLLLAADLLVRLQGKGILELGALDLALACGGLALASLHPRYAEISPADTSRGFLPFLLLGLALVTAGILRPALLVARKRPIA